MHIGSNSSYSHGTHYTIKLNDSEMLVVEEDPISRSQADAIKSDKEKKSEEEKQLQKSKKVDKPNELSENEKELVKDLSSRDAEVKRHEAAHQSAGGGMTGAASFTYQQGPDGKMYAIGGEVSISSTSGSTPEETIANARQIVAAAMAPASPSGQDFAVATSARVMEMKAQQQLVKERQQEQEGQNVYSTDATQSDSNKENTNFDISA